MSFYNMTKIFSSNDKPQFKCIVFLRPFFAVIAGSFVGQLSQDNIFGVLRLFVIHIVKS